MPECTCRKCRRRREPEWKYTLGADWSDHSVETRRNVEALLAYLTYEAKGEYVRDYDSPIGQFVQRRPGKLYRTR